MSKPAQFIFIGSIGLIALTSLVLVVLSLQKSSLSPQQETTPKITEISHPLGPIERNCLLVPTGVNPREGNFSNTVYQDPEALDTFHFRGELTSIEVKEFESEGSDCRYYAVYLKGGKGKVWPVYLPWNLLLSESQSLGRSDTDAQILEQLLGEGVTITIQFEKPTGMYKYFSWRVEVQ